MQTVPIIDLVGEYRLAAPFETVEGGVYRCASISSITALLMEGVDVYGDVYAPYELAREAYVEDVKANVNIIRLVSTAGHPTLVVPAPYLVGVPDINVVDYQRRLLTLDLGLLAKEVSLTTLKEDITQRCLDGYGITPTYSELSIAPKDKLSKADADRLEQARLGAKTYRRSDKASINYWMQRALNSEAYIARLEEALVNK